MDAIGDLLPKGRYQEPPEVQIVKAFVSEKFQQPCQVAVQPTQVIIQVKSSALAGALRAYLPELQDLCQSDKRFTIRIR